MPPEAKVWIYQSNRIFSDLEVKAIEKAGLLFIADWKGHGLSLKAGFDILYKHFIVISVDENQAAAGGCSTDEAVHFIKKLEQHFNLSLLDRMQLAYRKGEEIVVCHLSEFEKLATQKKVNESTIVFNNMVTTKAAFDMEWEVPLKQSWQRRVLA